MYSRPVLAFLGILVVFFAWGMIDFMGKVKIARENRKMAENKVAELKKEKEKLLSDIAKLKNPNGIEENIRLKFGLAREGERVVVVVENENKTESAPPAETKGFFYFLKNWFKK